MKAEELRIGNWVYDIRGEQNIKCTLQFMKQEIRLYPIPLTEEWLVKFGFKQTNGAFFELNGIGFIAGFSITDEFVLSGTFGPRHIHIYYVHQLQNLYFALTGEELKIKE